MTKQTVKPNTEEWYAERMTGIGASEAAGAVGLSQYLTPRHIYEQKRGIAEPDIDPEYAKRGHDLEDFIRGQFIDATGMKVGVRSPGLVRHPEHDFVFATPDFPIYRGSKRVSALECKSVDPFNSAMVRKLGEEGTDQLPDDWICQTQQQIACLEIDVLHVAVLVGFRLKTYEVERNDKLIDTLIEAEAELWERIQNADPPPVDFEHKKTINLLKQIYGVDEEKTIELSERSQQIWEIYEELGKKYSDIDTARSVLKAEVMEEMGDAHIGIFPDGEREIVRRIVPEAPVSYVRDSFVKLTCRKVKKAKKSS